jgi:Flp pilus assembly protein TadG
MKQLQAWHRRALAQRGAAGIEFALLFTIFFGVFYALLSYAFVMLLHQGLVQAAAEGARAAVQVDRTAFKNLGDYQTAGNVMARDATIRALSWLPASIRGRIESAGGITFNWTSSNVSIVTGNGTRLVTAQTITVRVSYLNYAARPVLPLIRLPGLGTIPNVPTNLVGASTLRTTN